MNIKDLKIGDAPFKFGFWPVRVNESWKYGKLIRTMDGYDKNGTDFENLPCPNWIEPGKTYTIEIKENNE